MASSSIHPNFNASAKGRRRKHPPPFSLRLTADERALLDKRAGGRSIGAYIRKVLFGDAASPRKVERRRPGGGSGRAAASAGRAGRIPPRLKHEPNCQGGEQASLQLQQDMVHLVDRGLHIAKAGCEVKIRHGLGETNGSVASVPQRQRRWLWSRQ